MIKTPKFLEGLSDNTLKYYKEFCDWQQHLIDTKGEIQEHEQDEFLDNLDEIWFDSSSEEKEEMKKLPFMYNFNKGKDLDDYPYAKYFLKQKPHEINKHTELKSKPYFGGEWKIPDAVFFFMIQEEKDDFIDLKLVSMSNNQYEDLQNGYEFVKYNETIPVFKKRELNGQI